MELYLKKQLLVVSCIYIGQIACGYFVGWPSNVVIKLQDPDDTPFPEPITDIQASWVGSLKFVGLLCSTPIGFLSNIGGRKPCLVSGGFILTICSLILALAKNVETVYAGRIIHGFPSGVIFIINLIYISEIASTNIRGILLAGTGVFQCVGMLIAYVVGPYVPYPVTGYVGLVFAASFTIGSLFIPETPQYYLLKGQEKEAREALIALGREADIDDVIHENKNEQIGIKEALFEIFTVKSNRKTFFITSILLILQQLSGVMVVLFFATSIFSLTSSSLEPHVSTIIIGVTQLIASFITPLFIERYGRKILLLISSSICSACLALLGLYFYLDEAQHAAASKIQWVPVVSLVIFIASYNFGFGIIPGTLAGEMFDSNVRSPGSVLSFNIGWLVGFIVLTTFGYMTAAIGAAITFWMYSVVCAVATVFTVIFVPETKGKSLLEIQQMLNK